MTTTKIKIEYDAMKKEALDFYTKEKGVDVIALLQEKMDDLYNTFVPEHTRKFVNHLSGTETVEDVSTPSPSKRKSKSLAQKEVEVPDAPSDIGMTLEQ